MADINTIATQFTQFYYETFDTNRANLASLYKPTSMLTFEGAQFQGTERIVEKLNDLPFTKVQHKITTTDAQPSSETQSSILVCVTGILAVDDSDTPLNFTQVFQLNTDGSSYYVFNDIFRLNYG